MAVWARSGDAVLLSAMVRTGNPRRGIGKPHTEWDIWVDNLLVA